jgi:uncharacterized membrane protein
MAGKDWFDTALRRTPFISLVYKPLKNGVAQNRT